MKQFIFIICFFCSCVSYAQSNRGWRAEIGTGIGTNPGSRIQSVNYIGASHYWELEKRFEIEPLIKLRLDMAREYETRKKYVEGVGFVYSYERGGIHYGLNTLIGAKASIIMRKKQHESGLNFGFAYDPGWFSIGRTYHVNIGTTHVFRLQKARTRLLLRPEAGVSPGMFYTLSLGIGLQWAKKPQTP